MQTSDSNSQEGLSLGLLANEPLDTAAFLQAVRVKVAPLNNILTQELKGERLKAVS